MFKTTRVQALFKTCKLRIIKVNDEQKRIAEMVFAVEPFPCSLAREISPDLPQHLFAEPLLSDSRPLGNVISLDWVIPARLYKLHIDVALDTTVGRVTIDPVVLQPLAIAMPDADAEHPKFVLTVTARHDIDRGTNLRGLADRFGSTIYVTFAEMNPGLYGEEMSEEELARQQGRKTPKQRSIAQDMRDDLDKAQAAGESLIRQANEHGMTVTVTTPEEKKPAEAPPIPRRGKKKPGRHNPEEHRKHQVQEGKSKVAKFEKPKRKR